MKLFTQAVIVMFVALFAMVIAANAQAGELKYSSEGELGDVRHVTIQSDGSLLATTRYGPLSMTTSISFDDRRIVVTEADAATVTLVTIDKQATLDAQQEGLLGMSLSEFSGWSDSANARRIRLPRGAGVIRNKSGNSCQTELDDLLSAADGMLTACGSGGGTIGAFMCLNAQKKYRDARDKYRKCVGPQDDQQPPM